MGYGFKHGAGGGGNAGLNFKVVGGTSQPTSASENAVWINTDTEITGWIFSSSEPEAPAEGVVWIETALTSDVSFNALKKNGIVLCLKKAYQYADGEFSPVAAYLYDGASWVEFSSTAVYLFLEGDTCSELTGGYSALAKPNNSGAGQQAPTVTYGTTMVMTSAGNTNGYYKGGMVYAKSKIDLTEYNTLIFEGTVSGVGTSSCALSIWSAFGTYAEDNIVSKVNFANGSDPVELDISDLTGSYYVGFKFNAALSTLTVTMNSLRLE